MHGIAVKLTHLQRLERLWQIQRRQFHRQTRGHAASTKIQLSAAGIVMKERSTRIRVYVPRYLENHVAFHTQEKPITMCTFL